MVLDELVTVLGLLLLVLVVVLVTFAVVLIGGALVAAVSYPLLFVLPSVRRGIIGITGDARRRPGSVVDPWLFAVHALFVYVYGLTVLAVGAIAAELIAAYGWPFPGDPTDLLPVVGVTTAVVATVAIVVRETVTRGRLRGCRRVAPVPRPRRRTHGRRRRRRPGPRLRGRRDVRLIARASLEASAPGGRNPSTTERTPGRARGRWQVSSRGPPKRE